MYTDLQQETLDINWFFTNSKEIGAVASGGGKLPASIANSADNNELMGDFFELLPEISKVEINPQLNNILSSKADDQYLADYFLLAEKGIFAFDKTVLNNFSDTNYHLVAKPTNPLKFESLPDQIKMIILKTKLDAQIGVWLDMTFIT